MKNDPQLSREPDKIQWEPIPIGSVSELFREIRLGLNSLCPEEKPSTSLFEALSALTARLNRRLNEEDRLLSPESLAQLREATTTLRELFDVGERFLASPSLHTDQSAEAAFTRSWYLTAKKASEKCLQQINAAQSLDLRKPQSPLTDAVARISDGLFPNEKVGEKALSFGEIASLIKPEPVWWVIFDYIAERALSLIRSIRDLISKEQITSRSKLCTPFQDSASLRRSSIFKSKGASSGSADNWADTKSERESRQKLPPFATIESSVQCHSQILWTETAWILSSDGVSRIPLATWVDSIPDEADAEALREKLFTKKVLFGITDQMRQAALVPGGKDPNAKVGNSLVTVTKVGAGERILPKTRGHTVKAIEFLAPDGTTIPSPNGIEVVDCKFAGFTLVVPPEASKMSVRYYLEASEEPFDHATVCALIRKHAPRVEFNPGIIQRTGIEAIKLFDPEKVTPEQRIMMLASMEAEQGWIYSTSPEIFHLQVATGDLSGAVNSTHIGACQRMTTNFVALASFLDVPMIILDGTAGSSEGSHKNGSFRIDLARDKGHCTCASISESRISTFDPTALNGFNLSEHMQSNGISPYILKRTLRKHLKPPPNSATDLNLAIRDAVQEVALHCEVDLLWHLQRASEWHNCVGISTYPQVNTTTLPLKAATITRAYLAASNFKRNLDSGHALSFFNAFNRHHYDDLYEIDDDCHELLPNLPGIHEFSPNQFILNQFRHSLRKLREQGTDQSAALNDLLAILEEDRGCLFRINEDTEIGDEDNRTHGAPWFEVTALLEEINPELVTGFTKPNSILYLLSSTLARFSLSVDNSSATQRTIPEENFETEALRLFSFINSILPTITTPNNFGERAFQNVAHTLALWASAVKNSDSPQKIRILNEIGTAWRGILSLTLAHKEPTPLPKGTPTNKELIINVTTKLLTSKKTVFASGISLLYFAAGGGDAVLQDKIPGAGLRIYQGLLAAGQIFDDENEVLDLERVGKLALLARFSVPKELASDPNCNFLTAAYWTALRNVSTGERVYLDRAETDPLHKKLAPEAFMAIADGRAARIMRSLRFCVQHNILPSLVASLPLPGTGDLTVNDALLQGLKIERARGELHGLERLILDTHIENNPILFVEAMPKRYWTYHMVPAELKALRERLIDSLPEATVKLRAFLEHHLNEKPSSRPIISELTSKTERFDEFIGARPFDRGTTCQIDCMESLLAYCLRKLTPGNTPFSRYLALAKAASRFNSQDLASELSASLENLSKATDLKKATLCLHLLKDYTNSSFRTSDNSPIPGWGISEDILQSCIGFTRNTSEFRTPSRFWKELFLDQVLRLGEVLTTKGVADSIRPLPPPSSRNLSPKRALKLCFEALGSKIGAGERDGFRQYQPGDALRDISARRSASRESPVVYERRSAQVIDDSITVLIDCEGAKEIPLSNGESDLGIIEEIIQSSIRERKLARVLLCARGEVLLSLKPEFPAHGILAPGAVEVEEGNLLNGLRRHLLKSAHHLEIEEKIADNSGETYPATPPCLSSMLTGTGKLVIIAASKNRTATKTEFSRFRGGEVLIWRGL